MQNKRGTSKEDQQATFCSVRGQKRNTTTTAKNSFDNIKHLEKKGLASAEKVDSLSRAKLSRYRERPLEEKGHGRSHKHTTAG